MTDAIAGEGAFPDEERRPGRGGASEAATEDDATVDRSVPRHSQVPRPVITSASNQSYQVKIDRLYDLAAAGDWADVAAFDVKGSNTYAKKVAGYRDALLAAAGLGQTEPSRYAPADGSELAEKPDTTVTPRDATAAERMRRHRARKRQAAGNAAAETLIFERQDWTLFLDPSTLPQRAGCQPNELGRVVLKELVDNALDTGAAVTLERSEFGAGMVAYTITDDGRGIDPAQVPRLFAVNRPLRSSKLKRLPLRGMLGHGLRVVMGAVGARNGYIAVASRGHRLTLAVDHTSGATLVKLDETIPVTPGTAVTIALPSYCFSGSEVKPARLTIEIARQGQHYTGRSLPEWYGIDAMHRLLGAVTPQSTTVRKIVGEVFGAAVDDDRPARSLSRDEVAELHRKLSQDSRSSKTDLGHVGVTEVLGEYYACVKDSTRIEGAEIPYTVEAWVSCAPAERGNGAVFVDWLLLNRTPSIAKFSGYSSSDGLTLQGCGLSYCKISGAKTAQYTVSVSVIAPYICLASDGKAPVLSDFQKPIVEAVRKAAGAAYRDMVRPPRQMSIKDAAWQAMTDAYLAASDGGKLPANARQIMYAARPTILKLTGHDKLNDVYFTQTLLPDYMEAHPDACRDWDVVFDARGHFSEPHTGRTVPLGTIDVRGYLGEWPWLGPAVELTADERYPTSGPRNRYRNVLFIEKEGFDPLLQAAEIAERFDIAIMSTKGMSTTASRKLLDRLAPQLDRVFVLHDFDVAGFSIFGTLASNGRRYQYDNEVPLVDIGLRLADVKDMELQAEPVSVSDWQARVHTLRRHGATDQEVAFLRSRRVELNTMTSRQFIDFLEAKFAEHGVKKVLPEVGVIEQHARRLIEQRLAREALAKLRQELANSAANYVLPGDLVARLQSNLDGYPSVAWDTALASAIDERTKP
jgi:hypothetical protein